LPSSSRNRPKEEYGRVADLLIGQSEPTVARRTLLMFLLLTSGGLAGCGGGGNSATASHPGASATSPAFTCPVSRRQVEAVYARVLFEDSTSTTTSCTFERYGEEGGSLSLGLGHGGPTAYRDAVGNVVAGQAVAGVGDEAIYSEGSTTLVARSGDLVLVLANNSLSGFDGAKDVASQSAARRAASIALAKVVLHR